MEFLELLLNPLDYSTLYQLYMHDIQERRLQSTRLSHASFLIGIPPPIVNHTQLLVQVCSKLRI